MEVMVHKPDGHTDYSERCEEIRGVYDKFPDFFRMGI